VHVRAARAALLIVAVLGGGVGAQRYTAPPPALDATPFPSSCAAAAQPALDAGAAWLHAFDVERARRAFEQAEAVDPDCALALWGQAMTWAGPLDAAPSMRAEQRARVALERAASLAARTPREGAYLAAAAALFAGDPPFASRLRAYRDALAAIVAASPADRHAQAWLALVTLRVSGGAPAERARAVVATLEAAFGSPPRWAPAAHYALLAHDRAQPGDRARATADWYVRHGPPAASARRIACRIFARLGDWGRVASLGEDAWRLAADDVGLMNVPLSAAAAESLQLRHLALLQLGRSRDAAATAALAAAVGAGEDAALATDEPRVFVSAALEMTVRDALERGRWEALAATPGADGAGAAAAIRWFARAVGYARRAGKGAPAEALAPALDAAARLDALADHAPDNRSIGILRAIARAAIAAVQEEREEMGLLLDEALRLDRLPAALDDLPMALAPAPEMAGDLWLFVDRTVDARRAYAESRLRYPGRARTLLGAARAAQRSQDDEAARAAYAALLSLWAAADDDLPELAEARRGARSSSREPCPQ
jgi:hypothetical protein